MMSLQEIKETTALYALLDLGYQEASVFRIVETGNSMGMKLVTTVQMTGRGVLLDVLVLILSTTV